MDILDVRYKNEVYVMNPNVLFILYFLIAIPATSIVLPLKFLSVYSVGHFIGYSIVPIILITIYNLKKDNTAIRNTSSCGIILWILITVLGTLRHIGF